MNNSNLIPVFSGSLSESETLLCDARKLHEFLQVKTRYSQWLKECIAEYGFLENQDFVIASEISEAKKGRGGHNKTEYHITLDMAKELAMVERNEQGRAARRYFIECEKKLQQAQMPPAKKALPAKIKHRIRSREDLSFTRRDNMGRLINWFPPIDAQGYDWYEAYAIGQTWFAEVVEHPAKKSGSLNDPILNLINPSRKCTIPLNTKHSSVKLTLPNLKRPSPDSLKALV